MAVRFPCVATGTRSVGHIHTHAADPSYAQEPPTCAISRRLGGKAVHDAVLTHSCRCGLRIDRTDNVMILAPVPATDLSEDFVDVACERKEQHIRVNILFCWRFNKLSAPVIPAFCLLAMRGWGRQEAYNGTSCRADFSFTRITLPHTFSFEPRGSFTRDFPVARTFA